MNSVSLVLTKQSSQSEIKMYFEGIMRLADSNEQFPVNLDEVWPLVYVRKDRAVAMLKTHFMESVDYKVVHRKVEQVSGAKYVNDYFLSLSCLEYFIARKVRPVFEVYRQVFHKIAQPKALSALDMLELSVKAARENQLQIDEVRQEVRELKAATQTRQDWFTIAGYATLCGISVNLKQASSLGRKASKLCEARGIIPGKLPDPRFGEVRTYPKEILEEVFSQPIN